MKNLFYLVVASAVFSLFAAGSAFGMDDSVIGKWKTVDSDTNEAESIVKIYEKDGKFFGEITDLFLKPDEDPNPLCDKCPDGDPRKDQPIKGMVILQDLEKDGEKYSGGKILDPGDGKLYTCKMWMEEGNLKVRGYIGFFYATQTWLPVQ